MNTSIRFKKKYIFYPDMDPRALPVTFSIMISRIDQFLKYYGLDKYVDELVLLERDSRIICYFNRTFQNRRHTYFIFAHLYSMQKIMLLGTTHDLIGRIGSFIPPLDICKDVEKETLLKNYLVKSK